MGRRRQRGNRKTKEYVVEYDHNKRASNMKKHGFDFAMAKEVWEGPHKTIRSKQEHVEQRHQTLGYLHEIPVLVVWNKRRGIVRRVISMRRANERDRKEFSFLLRGV